MGWKRRFRRTKPIFRRYLVIWWFRGRLGGGALLLEAPEVGEGDGVTALFVSDAALDLEERAVGGGIGEKGERIGGGIHERHFEAAPTLLTPLSEDHGEDR